MLKNPSSADENAADNTIRRVQTYVFDNFKDVLTINILNLYSIRATDAKEVATIFKAHGREVIIGSTNDEVIVEAVSEADYIITAWGGTGGIDRKEYDRRIDEVRELIGNNKRSGVPSFRVNTARGSEQYPFHACYWSSDHHRLIELK